MVRGGMSGSFDPCAWDGRGSWGDQGGGKTGSGWEAWGQRLAQRWQPPPFIVGAPWTASDTDWGGAWHEGCGGGTAGGGAASAARTPDPQKVRDKEETFAISGWSWSACGSWGAWGGSRNNGTWGNSAHEWWTSWISANGTVGRDTAASEALSCEEVLEEEERPLAKCTQVAAPRALASETPSEEQKLPPARTPKTMGLQTPPQMRVPGEEVLGFASGCPDEPEAGEYVEEECKEDVGVEGRNVKEHLEGRDRSITGGLVVQHRVSSVQELDDELGSYLMEGFLEEGRRKYGDDGATLDLLCPRGQAVLKWDLGPGFGTTPEAGPQGSDPWAVFRPGQAVYSPCGPGGMNGPGGPNWAGAAAAYTNTNDKVSIRLNKDLAAKWSARDILETAELHLAQFDVINAVTALHRVAKSTDRFEAQRDEQMNATLLALIDKVVVTVTDSLALIEAKEVTKTCWALSKLGLGHGSTMDAIAEQVVLKVGELDGQGLSNSVWGFATARIKHKRLLSAVAAEAVRQLEDFDPQGLSNSAWAFAKLSHHEAALMKRLSEEVTQRADDFDPQGLSNTGWAFATLGLRNHRLMDAICDEMIAGITRWSPQNIGNLTWAFAKLQMMSQKMVDAVSTEVIQTIYDWNPQGIANVTWSFAKLKVNHPQYYEIVAQDCTLKITSFQPQNLVNIAWSYAKLGMKKYELFEGISQNIASKAAEFNPQHCSNAVWAFGTLGIPDVPMLDAVAQRVAGIAHTFLPQDLSNIAWAFAKLTRQDQELMAVISREVIRKVRVFQPQNLSITAYAFGQLTIQNKQMLDAIMEESERKVAEFDGQGLSNLCQSMAKLNMPNSHALKWICTESEGKMAHFTNQELAMVAWSYAKMGILDETPLQMVTNETRARLDRLTPQDLSVLIWAYARSGSKSREVMEILAWEVVKRKEKLIPQDLGNITWAYATVGIKNDEMMEAIAEESIRKVGRFTIQDLANCSWGFAKLDILHSRLLEVLADEMVRRIVRLEPQHMSITTWAHARLGFVHKRFLVAVAKAAAKNAAKFDAQGIGNIVWGYGVLGFESEALVNAMASRAESIAPQLSSQEISNIAYGIHSVGQSVRLRRFLEVTTPLFCRFAGSTSDGPSWADFANIVFSAVRSAGELAGSNELETIFRRLFLDPVTEGLSRLAAGPALGIPDALASLQIVLDTNGIPYFGEFYTREVLQKLDILAQRSGDGDALPGWALEARRRCLEASSGDWRIPCTDTILAHASWDLQLEAKSLSVSSAGRVFRASWTDGIDDHIKELLQPLRQHIKRDMHPERVALLELIDEAARAGIAGEDSLRALRGSVRMYVSQYPCVSCLGVFCQLVRRCPCVTLEVDFDSAWSTHFGQPRHESRCKPSDAQQGQQQRQQER